MSTIKDIKKAIITAKEFGNNLSVSGLEPMLDLQTDFICVKNCNELIECSRYFATLDDVGSCFYTSCRLDINFKNGKRALTIFLR